MPRLLLSPPGPRPAALIPSTASPRAPFSHHRGLATPPTPRIFPRSTLPPPSYCPRGGRDAEQAYRIGLRSSASTCPS
uniref:Uncharacterized protein n=1 Tax=Aegilops tauschii subsp. strangulata TaxID=200361 RepID=A0A453T1B4_AEGTS